LIFFLKRERKKMFMIELDLLFTLFCFVLFNLLIILLLLFGIDLAASL